jgi:uncharacterized membrane protein
MWTEWANLLLRWFHVFTAFLWIGQTWLFLWMEQRFEDAEENPGGRVHMVHSGGFYVVEKHRGFATLPKTLHAFKWEAALTWMSGLGLYVLLYYNGGLLLDYDSTWPLWGAIALSVILMAVARIAYDVIWRLAQGPAAVAVSFVAIVFTAWALGHVFSARAVYLQVGAMLGTIMTANVWDRIIPAQQNMIAAIREGRPPDLSLGEKAKECSKHNSFIVLPVVAIMLSNHFPTATYGHRHAWAVLGGLVLLGWSAAAVARRR